MVHAGYVRWIGLSELEAQDVIAVLAMLDEPLTVR